MLGVGGWRDVNLKSPFLELMCTGVNSLGVHTYVLFFLCSHNQAVGVSASSSPPSVQFFMLLI